MWLCASQPYLGKVYVPAGVGSLEFALPVLAARGYFRSVNEGFSVDIEAGGG